MRLLLDTHLLLWALMEPERLPTTCREQIENRANDVRFSLVSIWEIAIKTSLRRFDFPHRPAAIVREAVDNGFTELAISSGAVCHVAELPHHHRDPFDRLLIAQAVTEPVILYTVDARLPPYSDLVQLAV